MADAAKSGTFKIGGDIVVHRLGFGAMRITGKGVWGEPANPGEAIRLLKRLPHLNVNFIDTAHAYGPEVSERLLHEALHPYRGILIATKAGLDRPGPGSWVPNGRPEVLIAQAHRSREILKVEQIGLWQLHRIDSKVPAREQFAAIKSLIADGVIRHAGLSEVSVGDIEEASKFFKVATVQNRYNIVDRTHEAVLDYCGERGIGFIPFFPLAAGDLAKTHTALEHVARRHRATTGQIALAWLLKRSPVMLPIPGTSQVAHLEENTAAAEVELSHEEFEALNKAGKHAH
ncbi:MAG TPA: aldo/keto reductase [Rhizomicrobium sp.]|nr:aldo/keto reductase [Rhizomicrobium sp.]